VCAGSGKLPPTVRCKSEQERKSHIAAVLVANGVSYRQAAQLCGYKSTRSVSLAVKKHK